MEEKMVYQRSNTKTEVSSIYYVLKRRYTNTIITTLFRGTGEFRRAGWFNCFEGLSGGSLFFQENSYFWGMTGLLRCAILKSRARKLDRIIEKEKKMRKLNDCPHCGLPRPLCSCSDTMGYYSVPVTREDIRLTREVSPAEEPSDYGRTQSFVNAYLYGRAGTLRVPSKGIRHEH